jgi:Flp pilus assembly protein TadG
MNQPDALCKLALYYRNNTEALQASGEAKGALHGNCNRDSDEQACSFSFRQLPGRHSHCAEQHRYGFPTLTKRLNPLLTLPALDGRPDVTERGEDGMRKLLRNLWNDERGNTIILAAAAMPLLIGSAGLATDTIQWALWKRQLQRAADSAAIAGVYDRFANEGATTNTAAAVDHDITLNHHTNITLQAGYPQVSYPADAGNNKNQVRVVLAVKRPLSFSGMFMSDAPLIRTAAQAAAVQSSGEFCVLSLQNNSKTGIQATGNNSIVMDCGMMTNSTATNAAAGQGSASVTATTLAASGGIQQSNTWTVGSYQPYSPSLEDPYEDLDPDGDEKAECASHPHAPPADSNTSPGPYHQRRDRWQQWCLLHDIALHRFEQVSDLEGRTVPHRRRQCEHPGQAVPDERNACSDQPERFTQRDDWDDGHERQRSDQRYGADHRQMGGHGDLPGPAGGRQRANRQYHGEQPEQDQRQLDRQDHGRRLFPEPAGDLQRHRHRHRHLHPIRRQAALLVGQLGPQQFHQELPQHRHSGDQRSAKGEAGGMIRLLHALRSDNRGAAIIELAMVAPVIALLTIGVVDLSNGFGRKLRLEQAAQRSIEKVMQTTGTLTVEETIANEAVCQYNGTQVDGTCKTAPLTTDNVTVTHRLECDGTLTTDPDCASNQTESRWVQVTVSDDYTPMFPIHFSGIDDGNKYHITAIAGMRTE